MTFGETVVAVTNISHSSSSTGSVTLFTCPADRYAHVSISVNGTGVTALIGSTIIYSETTDQATRNVNVFLGPGQTLSYNVGTAAARSASGVALQFNLP